MSGGHDGDAERCQRVLALLDVMRDWEPTVSREELPSTSGPAPSTWVDCRWCQGKGTVRGGPPCPECDGRGLRLVDRYLHEAPAGEDGWGGWSGGRERETMESHEIDRALETLEQTEAEREGNLDRLRGREDRAIARSRCRACDGKGGGCGACHGFGLSPFGEIARAMAIMMDRSRDRYTRLRAYAEGGGTSPGLAAAVTELASIVRGPVTLPRWVEREQSRRREGTVKEVYARTGSLTKTAKEMKMDRRHVRRLLALQGGRANTHPPGPA